MRVCKNCGNEREENDFTSKRGVICAQCKLEKKKLSDKQSKEYKKQWYEKNKKRLSEEQKKKYQENREELIEYQREYRKKNSDKVKKRNKKYYKENKDSISKQQAEYNEKNKKHITEYKKQWAEENKERLKEYRKQWAKENKDKIKETHRKRIETDPIYVITVHLRKNILKAFRNRSFEKNNSTVEILGCSFEEFKNYLENKFEVWMSWENRGLYNGEFNYGWDIDHIIPLSSANSVEDIIKLNHYTNLQPLCSKVNREIKKDN